LVAPALRLRCPTPAALVRLAAALLLDWLIADAACVPQLEQAWGKPDTLTKSGESKPAIAHARLLLLVWRATLPSCLL